MGKNIEKSISIIIVTFNGFRYIKESIDSVINQTFKNIEIIVIDDGSTDSRLKDVLSPYIKNNIIKYFYKENGGQGSARNLGIKNSIGNYIAFLDDDDYWESNKLKEQFNSMELNKDYILTYTKSYFIKVNDNLNKELFLGNNYSYYGMVLNRLIFRNFITLSSVLIRKEYMINNLFNESEDLRRFEDYDLWLILSTLGKIGCIPKPLTFYRTKLPLNNNQKVNDYYKIMNLFKGHILKSKIRYKLYYILGWLFYFFKFLFFKTKSIYG